MHKTATPKEIRLAVLISGGGTTLRNLIRKIESQSLAAKIELVISSNPLAKGLEFAQAAGIPCRVFSWHQYECPTDFSQQIFDACRQFQVDLVVMGGFLKQVVIPPDFDERVVNIHPSLIPKYCGRGFYGHFVHEAVLAAGEKESGCTVHYVDNEYDHGPVIEQARVPVLAGDTPDTLAARVFEAECELYPRVIHKLGRSMLAHQDRRAGLCEPD